MRILLQTSIAYVADDWNVSRFSLLAEHLRSVADVIARDRQADASGNDPILTGLSATFLYRSRREIGGHKLVEDDVRGGPIGHFVVLCGWDAEERSVRVADPLADTLRFHDHIYWLPVQRVINAILLGVLTYDANLLVIDPPENG